VLRLIGLLTLLVIVWLAVSSGLITKLRPHIERAVVVGREVAGNMQRHLEGLEEDKKVLMPLDGEEVTSEEHVVTTEDPYQRLIEQGLVTEEFQEKGRTPLEVKSRDESIEGGSNELAGVGENQAQTKQFPDFYEEMKYKLLQATDILEGRQDG